MLDLGSGGGIDVLLSSEACRAGGQGLRPRHDRRDACAGTREHRKGPVRVDQRRVPEGRDRGHPAARTGRVDVYHQQLRRQSVAGQGRRCSHERPVPCPSAGWPPRDQRRRRRGRAVAEERAERGSFVGCIAGALSFSRVRDGTDARRASQQHLDRAHARGRPTEMYGAIVQRRRRRPSSTTRGRIGRWTSATDARSPSAEFDRGRRGARSRVRGASSARETIARFVAASRSTAGRRRPGQRSISRCSPIGSRGNACSALGQAEGTIAKDQPEVLFVCVHNAGRSQMAARLLRSSTRGDACTFVRPGARPPSEINPAVVEAMARGRRRHLEGVPEAAHRRVRPGLRRRDHDGLRRRVPDLSREALRGLGARRPGRQDARGGPADPRRAGQPYPRAPHRTRGRAELHPFRSRVVGSATGDDEAKHGQHERERSPEEAFPRARRREVHQGADQEHADKDPGSPSRDRIR